MRIQRQAEQLFLGTTTLDDYRWERDRQIREQEKTTGGYDTDTQGYYDHGGQRAITLKDWMRSRKPGPGEQAAAAAGVDPDFHYEPPAGSDFEPAW